MLTSHVLTRVLIVSGFVAAVGTALVQFRTPPVQSISTDAGTKAPQLSRIAGPEPSAERSAPVPAPSPPLPAQPPAIAAAVPPQYSAPVAQPAAMEPSPATAPPAAQARIAAVQPPSPAPIAQPSPAEQTGALSARKPDSNLVDINTASVDQLNGLGGRFGKAIVRGRPYRSIEELVSKRILTRATFNKIKDQIAAR